MPRRSFLIALCLFASAVTWTPNSLQAAGPDVTVGDLFGVFGTSEQYHAVQYYGNANGLAAYSVGAIACNIGDEPVDWVSNTELHPVESRQLYRIKNGRFEQIGMSWVKHGFYALSRDDCNLGCPPDALYGTLLDVNCSHPSNSLLCGNQYILGPRGHINAFTGEFPYHFNNVAYPPLGLDAVIGRRLQIPLDELRPSLNPDATYLLEAQIIAADDCLSGNGENNISYRPVSVVKTGEDAFQLTLVGSTATQEPAIHAWQKADPGVTLTTVRVPGEGLYILGSKTTHLGGNLWHYEYALYNQTSDRAAWSFRVPIGNDPVISDAGFHDIDHHSGDGLPEMDGSFSNEDWTFEEFETRISWSSMPYSRAPQANALRWGTVYNFWFDANRPPVSGDIQIGLFKPGVPDVLNVTAPVPDASDDPDVIAAASNAGIAATLFSCIVIAGLLLRRREQRAHHTA